jgi:GST-like protein
MTQLKLLSWGTPNGLKPLLMLEELGVPYELVKIDIGKAEQKTPEFLAKNANGRIPVLETEIDGAPVAIAESAAILVHLAETNGGRFLPASGAARASTFQWTFFQMGSVGPMFGQLGFWKRREAKNEEAIERYLVETKRVFGVLDDQLSKAAYLAGPEYSIADMATLFWCRRPEFFGLTFEPWPNVQRWVRALEERPAVKATLAVTWP